MGPSLPRNEACLNILRRLATEKNLKMSEVFPEPSDWLSFRDTLFEQILNISVTEFTAPIIPGEKSPIRDLLPASTSSSSPLRHFTHLLPTPIISQLTEIHDTLQTLPTEPPHTAQRLAELILEPKRHYRHLVAWIHAVDRIIHVTSGFSTYPLPPVVAVPFTGADQAGASWGAAPPVNPGSDEALGGALLTTVPWLMGGSEDAEGDDEDYDMDVAAQREDTPEVVARKPEIRTASTMTIDGPNGMGSIETVTISLHGNNAPLENKDEKMEGEEEEEEMEHVRGPQEIGVTDLGPQSDQYGTAAKPELVDDKEEDDVESKALEDDEMDEVDTRSKRGASKSDDETPLKKFKNYGN